MTLKKILTWGFALIIFTPFVLMALLLLDDYIHQSREAIKEETIKQLILECKSAASSRDFKTAYEMIEKLQNELEYHKDADEYKETYDYIFREEALYLCAKDDEDSHNRLTFLLTSIPVKGKALPEGTPYNNSTWHEITDGVIEHKDYRDYVVDFNQKCDYIIDLAIANHKYKIVEYVFPLYKLVPEPLKEPKEIVDTDSTNKKFVLYKISYSNSDRENARNKINKAIKEGAFPGIANIIK